MKKLILIFLMFIISSCGLTIKEIKNNPKNYNGKEVELSGNIIRIFKIPFMTIKFYELYDNTDTIFVISLKSQEYNKNDKVKIKGKIYILEQGSNFDELENLINSITILLIDNKIVSDKNIANQTAKIVIENLKSILKELVGVILIEY